MSFISRFCLILGFTAASVHIHEKMSKKDFQQGGGV